MQISKFNEGQILAELLVAIAVLVVLGAFGAQLVYVSLRGSEVSKERSAALRLAQEATEALRAISLGNDTTSQGWNRIYKPPGGSGDPATSKGSGNPYYPIISTSTPAQWIIFTGTESITIEGETYLRKIVIDNVSRDSGGAIESIYNSANDDPGTQKITITVSKSGSPDTLITDYFTRFINDSGPQSDWGGVLDCNAISATSSLNKYCSQTCIDRTGTAGSIKLLSGC